MTSNQQSDAAPEEMETARLVQAALEGPARPLRADQMDRLVRAAVARQTVPGWVLLTLAVGPLVVILIAILSGFHWNGLGGLVLAIPLVNLALSPFAALLLYMRLARPARPSPTETPVSGDLL